MISIYLAAVVLYTQWGQTLSAGLPKFTEQFSMLTWHTNSLC